MKCDSYYHQIRTQANGFLAGMLLLAAIAIFECIYFGIGIGSLREKNMRLLADNEYLEYQLSKAEQRVAELEGINDELKRRIPIKAETIEDMITEISISFGLPPGFVKAIAYTENNTLKPTAVNRNRNGTLDRGIMQLNNEWFNTDLWDRELINIIAACIHIYGLRTQCSTWWEVAVAYNCGIYKVKNPPTVSLDYAAKVMTRWQVIEPENPLNKGGR